MGLFVMKMPSNSSRANEKIRTGISISKDLLKECDKYLSESEFENRSELIESALKLFLATRNISEKSEVLVPELAECVIKASDDKKEQHKYYFCAVPILFSTPL